MPTEQPTTPAAEQEAPSHERGPSTGKRILCQPVRRRARGPVVGARAGQPDRRAHGLQRRLRVSDRDRQAHHGSGPRQGRPSAAGREQLLPRRGGGQPRRPGSRFPDRLGRVPPGRGLGDDAGGGRRRRSFPAGRHGPGPDLGRAGRRRAVVLRRSRMRGGPGPERSLGARAGPAGTGPDRPAGGEQGGRRAHRHHGPVGVAPGRAGSRHPAGLPEPVDRERRPRLRRRRGGAARDRHPHQPLPCRRRLRQPPSFLRRRRPPPGRRQPAGAGPGRPPPRRSTVGRADLPPGPPHHHGKPAGARHRRRAADLRRRRDRTVPQRIAPVHAR